MPVKLCATCRHELTAKERSSNHARCKPCRERIPGHVFKPQSGTTWRSNPAIVPREVHTQPTVAVNGEAWWAKAAREQPRDEWNAIVQTQGDSMRMKKAGRGRVSVPGHIG